MMQLKLSFALLCIFSLLLVSSIILYFHIQPSGLPLRNESYVSLPKQMEKCQSAPAMKTNIFFLKTHKTAGTTIYSILSRFGARHSLNFMLPKHDRFDLGSEGPVKFKDINSETVPLDKKFNIFAFHSRYSRETNKFLYPDVMRVTILRSPPEHLESVFSFYGIKRRLKVSFHEFVEAPTKAPEGEVSRAAHTVWNEMSRDLGMNKSDFESNQKIGEFIRFVDQEFHLVMIAEHLEASLVLLADLMSWPLHYVASIPIHVRRSKSRSSISYEDRRMVLQFHRADHLLYQHFLAIFGNRVLEYGFERMAADIQRLQAFDNELKQRCRNSQKATSDLDCWLATRNAMQSRKTLMEMQISRLSVIKRLQNLVAPIKAPGQITSQNPRGV